MLLSCRRITGTRRRRGFQCARHPDDDVVRRLRACRRDGRVQLYDACDLRGRTAAAPAAAAEMRVFRALRGVTGKWAPAVRAAWRDLLFSGLKQRWRRAAAEFGLSARRYFAGLRFETGARFAFGRRWLRMRLGAAVLPRRGLEPPRGFPHWHLKPARLPIPPPRHRFCTNARLYSDRRCLSIALFHGG